MDSGKGSQCDRKPTICRGNNIPSAWLNRSLACHQPAWLAINQPGLPSTNILTCSHLFPGRVQVKVEYLVIGAVMAVRQAS